MKARCNEDVLAFSINIFNIFLDQWQLSRQQNGYYHRLLHRLPMLLLSVAHELLSNPIMHGHTCETGIYTDKQMGLYLNVMNV